MATAALHDTLITIPHLESEYDDQEVTVPLEVEEVTEKKKRTRPHKVYLPDQTYETAEQAEVSVSDEKCWSKTNIITTVDGQKQFYRCNMCVQRGPQCAAGVYILYHADSLKATVFRTNCKSTTVHLLPCKCFQLFFFMLRCTLTQSEKRFDHEGGQSDDQ